MLKLIIEDDQKQVKVVKLLRDEITIGRKEGNTIRLTDRNVSRFHARILHKDGRFILEDRDSYNGVFVNGKRIKGTVDVSPGDKIKIGDYVLTLKVDAEGKAPDPFEEMKTVPLEQVDKNTLAEQPAPASSEEQEIPVTEAYRLGVMSTHLSGSVYPLTRKVTVIGRTPDNDIVLDHKSISRHHARIERDGDVYTIFDMESSNGVRINGDLYKKMALRRGDVIDLGHVRLKFLSPDEEFNPAAELMEEGRGSKMGIMLGAAAVALAVIIIGAFWVMGSSSSESGDSAASVKKDYLAKITEISNLISAKEWNRAEIELTSLLEDTTLPDSVKQDLIAKKTLIKKEKKYARILDEADKAGTLREDWKTMYDKAASVPSDSVYYAKAKELKEQALLKLRESYESDAKAALVKGNCGLIEQKIEDLHSLSAPEDELLKLKDLLQKCRNRAPKVDVAAVPPMAPAPAPTPAPAPAVTQKAPAAPVAPPMKAAAVSSRGKRRYHAMKKTRTTRRYSSRKKSSGGSCPKSAVAQVYRACKSHQRSKARRLWHCVPASRRGFLKSKCKGYGVSLP